ncbi:MAG: hypothetical protein RBT33_01790 [Candidatus Dojkabacteria bacterium]|jgi:regulator of RNase E activity RraB|nr:hypothetical protein [Candidatus Dojkabacteria bacterium]
MGVENKERKLVGEKEREALVYSFDIIKVALSHGWRIRIFQKEYNLLYLEKVLRDSGVDPNAFFSFREFRSKEGIHSAYDWAREVQKVAYESYNTEEIEDEECMESMKILDQAYKDEVEPWKALTSEQLVDINSYCKRSIDTLYYLA